MTAGNCVQVTLSPEDTGEVGEHLASHLRPGDVVMLTGPIGAGKSVLARGIASALGVDRWRGSPTFNLIHEYRTRPPLYHLDLYRLSAGDVEDLGLEEYARPDSILVVEWADRARACLRSVAWGRIFGVDLEYLGGDRRRISICGEADPGPADS